MNTELDAVFDEGFQEGYAVGYWDGRFESGGKCCGEGNAETCLPPCRRMTALFAAERQKGRRE